MSEASVREDRVEVSSWIAHWGSWAPAKTALRFEGRELDYGELDQHVGSAAGWLRTRGVFSGDRVGYLGPSCPELLELLFACARAGATFVPFNNRMPAAELSVFVRATRPRLIVAEASFLAVALESVADLGPDRVATFEVGRELAGMAPVPEPELAPADPTPALILFTSGTTGRPRGATFTHQNLAFNALNIITAFGLTAGDEILTALPMFHAGGLGIHTTPGLCAGATITIQREFDPGRLLEEIQRRRITLLACTPSMTRQLTGHPAWAEADLSSLRSVVTGSTTVPRSAIEPWLAKGVPIVQGYGGTEVGPIATTMPPGSPPEAAYTAGKPVAHTEVRIVGGSGRPLPLGEPGEVWVRGPAVMRSYWENPTDTSEAFRDGWFHNGDLGFVDRDGCLHIVGRLADVIIVGASNVYPGDLEAVLEGCADVREAAVVGRPDDELGEVPVACVVPTAGRTLDAEQVLALFDNRLAPYKYPRDVVFLDALPRNWHGKVDRRRLREILVSPATRSHEVAGSPPRADAT